LLLRGGLDVARKGRLAGVWWKSLPISAALTLAWSGGELAGYLAGEGGSPIREAGVRESHANR
jgi:hypothetical protein